MTLYAVDVAVRLDLHAMLTTTQTPLQALVPVLQCWAELHSCVSPSSAVHVAVGLFWYALQDTKIRVILDGPPAPPSPVPEVNEQDDSESTRTGTASAGGHHEHIHPAAAVHAGRLTSSGVMYARVWQHTLT